MKAYKYYVPTPIFYGDGCVKKNAELLCSFGKRAFIVTSVFMSGCRNYALEDVIEIFEANGVAYAINDTVEENPPVENVAAITDDARKFKPDFIVGVGGGSALDAAKAVNHLLAYPAGTDPYQAFFGGGGSLYGGGIRIDRNLPIVGIPTTAGTGSEVTAGAVLTRMDTDNKDTPPLKLYLTVAFLDAHYIEDSPSFLIHTGVMDALAHGVECYVNTGANFMNRSIAEIGFKLFSEFKDNMLNNTLTHEDYEKMLIAANVMGMAFGQAGTTLPHGLGYPLSHYKQLNHGLSCSMTMGEYIRGFKDTSIIENIIDLCGFKSVDEFADYVNEILSRDVHIKVTREEIAAWTEQFWTTQHHRLPRHPEPISKEEIHQIYLRALDRYIVD